ncbi:MAG: DUF5011 domain-containing protein [Eggerthellaceae bacterium]|nr:DUF5011 domain-containing protein [Eggerthellaceae bacterium]
MAQKGTPAYNNAFFDRSNFSIYDRTSPTFAMAASATKALVSDGGFGDAGNQPLKQGDQFTITLRCVEDPAAETTIIAFVDNALPPSITAPVRIIWTGPAADQPAGTILQSEWTAQNGMNGVVVTDDFDADIQTKLKIGSVNGGGVFTEGNPVSLAPEMYNLWQDVSYSATDSDHNTTVETFKVLATDNFALIGDYLPMGYSFVKLSSEVDSAPAAILAETYSTLWRIKSNNPAESVPVDVSNLLFIGNDGGYTNIVKDYPILVDSYTPETGFEGHATLNLVGKVVEHDELADGFDAAMRYAVAASNGVVDYADAASVTGTGAAAATRLIAATGAEAWKIPGAAINPHDVKLVSNQIGAPGHPAVPNGEYEVVFAPVGQDDIFVTVMVTLSSGNWPEITFTQAPLVLEQTPASKPLTDADLKASMTVMDVEDGNLLTQTSVTVEGGLTLNQNNIGVWQVDYSVTDSHGNTTTASRAVVITDGRYIIDPNDDVIIGARDYVVASKDVEGSEGQARSLSYAEAFSISGERLAVNWTGQPAGYTANAPAGNYPITWKAQGRNTTKAITARVVDADVIDSGGKDSSYAILANHFQVNVADAQGILNGGQAAFIEAASAEVVKLVPSVADRAPVLVSSDGFTAAEGIYEPITFKIDGIPETEQSASVRGIVSQGSLPTITASTPLEVWIGTGPKPASAITAAQYSALYDVTASDPEDGNLTSAVTYTADAATGDVDVTQVGMYKLTYDVVDSDGNHPAVLPTRMVIVNDGRYVVGSNRILSAESFVTLLEDVTTNPSLINTEILLKSSAALYNGETGALVSSTDLSVVSTGGYGRVEGSYNIIIEGIDSGTSKISRAIVGEVIDAQVIDYGPKPNDPDQDTYYVYGNNIELEVFEAEAITTDAQLLAALGAGARVARPNGTLGDITPIIADRGGFKAETGTYWVTIQDPDGNASARLSVKVNPTVLPWIDATPKPLEYTYRLGSTDMLSRADIMSGVTAGDGNDGSLTSRVVINPDATNAEQLPAIAWGSASVTQITYSVTNNNGFTETVDRALIVNDGSIRFDDRYILQGKSFLIEAKDVTLPYNTLIMEQTEAQAWHTDGTPATAVIRDAGGFGPVKGDYGIVLTVQEDVALTRSVTAKVVDSNIGNGDQYSIEAKDFRINLADARALQAKSGAAYDSEFLSRSGAASYLRADANLSRGGTPALTNDGGFKTATFALESDPAYPSTFQVSFWVTEDHSAAVTITVTVSNGNYPWIEVPGLRQTPLNSTFDYMGGVTYGDAEDATELLVTSYTNTVDTALEGVYEVTYTVTDTEGNTTEATGFVLVGDWMIDGDYAVTARNFVTTAADVEAASSLDGLITALSKADAIQVVRNDQDIITGIEHIAPIVKDRANLAAAEGTYEPIKIGVAEPTPVIEIQATVLDRDVISNTPDENGNVNDTNTDDPTDANRYVVAANHVTLTWSQAGALAGKTDAATKATLIELAEAEGFKISPEGNLSAHAVDVPANGNGVKQEIGAFDVTFIPQNVGGVSVTVQFTVAKSGSPTFSVDGPLVVPTTPGSSILTDDQLLDGVDVSDPDNANLGLDDVAITDHTRDARPLIDTSRVGVHQVVYTVEDPVTGEPTSVTRAVVVDDGRFVTDSDTQTIVGAKNFVVAAKDPAFAGSLANAIALSAAEAYDFEGEPLTVALTSTLPAGFASKTPGVYDFTFAAQGIASPTTTITGEVVDADVVDLGPDPYASQYALIASNFTMTVAEAAGVVGEAGLIDAASVRVIKLVSSAADANPVVVNNGGFTAVRGDYPLTFAIAGVDPAQRQPINVVGTVTDDSPPTLSVTAPFEITPGTTWDDIVAMTGVSATDAAGNDITDQVTFTPETMDTSQVGIHQVTYTVTDDEGNTTTTTRAVVVNDGRYVLGQGRILEANSFVIRLADVVANSSQMSQHLIGQTQAHVYDGVTGDELPASLLSIADTGNYQRSIGAYDIVVAAADDPAGTITKAIVGTVVDADVIEDNPLDPDDPNGPVMYVFGKNTTMRVAEAAAILGARPMGMMLMAADRLVSDDALIEALLGGAILADPITGNELKPVKVLSTGGFAAVPGTYKVVLADVDEIAQAELTVSVTAGEPPVVNVPRPLKLPVSSTPGNLTSDQMKGSSTAYDPEDGDLTNRIEVIGDVPGDEPGIYVVTLRVTDSDGNETIVTSAFVVDDGSFVFGDDYILSAHDFTIAHSDVDLGNKSGQIIAQSGAVAARYDGTPAVVNVTADGGYTNVGGQYAVQISVASEPSLKTNITATVTAPANNRYAVKFDPNGGTLTGPSTIYVVEPATTLSYLPSSPVRDGYVFTYWALTPEGGTQFTPSTPVLSDMTVYAQWEKAAVPPAPEPAPAPASPKGPSSPKTGDDTNPWVWVGLLGVSAAGLGLAFARRRRSSEEEDEG